MYDGAIFAHLESSFRDREVIPGQMVFPYPFTVKGASALFLFNQHLRRVNMASAAHQRGRRPVFFLDLIILPFPRIEDVMKATENIMLT